MAEFQLSILTCLFDANFLEARHQRLGRLSGGCYLFKMKSRITAENDLKIKLLGASLAKYVSIRLFFERSSTVARGTGNLSSRMIHSF